MEQKHRCDECPNKEFCRQKREYGYVDGCNGWQEVQQPKLDDFL